MAGIYFLGGKFGWTGVGLVFVAPHFIGLTAMALGREDKFLRDKFFIRD